MRKRVSLTLLIIFLTITFVSLVSAGDKIAAEKPWRRFSLSLGANFNNNRSEVRLGAKGVGASLDVEELLGLDVRTTSFKADGFWRFTKRRKHRLDFSWFAIQRSGENKVGIQNPIDIGDITIKPGATVNTEFDIDIYQVGYSYSFIQDERLDLAIGVGAFIMPISFDLRVDNLGEPLVATSESITAPLPVFGLHADIAITPKWFLRSKAQFFYLEIGDFRGRITDTLVALEYMAFKNVGFGLNVENLSVAVEAKGGDYPGIDFVGRVGFDLLGSMLYVKFFFGK